VGQRRGFTSEYRRDVAGQVIGTGCTIASVTRDLGLGEQMVGRWVKAERERREAGAAGVPGPRELAAENVRLRRRVRELEMENEFLGKSQRPRCFQAPAAWRLALMEAEKAGYPIALMARAFWGHSCWFLCVGGSWCS
jgi:transposase